jgi:leucyl/phenylalanyl-tRNA---protein transferase
MPLVFFMYYYLFDDNLIFPHPSVVKPSGILAVGGTLSIERLTLAYSFGIFPWYSHNEPVIWWCPDPRFVIFPSKVKISKSLRNYFNQNRYSVTYNQEFESVIRFCQLVPRSGQDGTWINEDIVISYIKLHEIGKAISVEVWDGNELAGGLYGVVIGKCFFGESMFSLKSNASKYGFVSLAKKLEAEGFFLIDCQQPNPYLTSLGGEFISGKAFQDVMRKNILLTLDQQ